MQSDLNPPSPTTAPYRSITLRNVAASPFWRRLPSELREQVRVVGEVLPFRTNAYVVEELIDWSRVPDDPIFRLNFPLRAMLADEDYRRVRDVLRHGAPHSELKATTNAIRGRLNPHPAGQLTHNVPTLDERNLEGLQHKYGETVLFFPAQAQTCHAYCTYCFRWAQFVDLPDMRFMAREVDDLLSYLLAHPGISDVLFTGGDPMVMRTRVLQRYVEPLLERGPDSLRALRLGTKALAYWPQRFLSDPDADDLLRLFERIVASGRHLALMAHFSHPVELSTDLVIEAMRRIRATGAEIRVQAPLIRHVNDAAPTWAELWRRSVSLGAVPYYMFVERDTGARRYFEVPLARVYEIFRDAYSQVSGLARTVRGPSMSAFPGKVRVLGIAEIGPRRCFVLDFLQARNAEWVGRPFFARYDPEATWLDDLQPALGEPSFFWQEELEAIAS